ncbi:MAG: GAF domain-containing protein [Nitrospinota bacterium]
MRLEEDLLSLVDLLSNVTDAYTAALFFPRELDGRLQLRNCHTLSDHVPRNLVIDVGQGLIGWVAERGEALHSTEFKHDLSALGLYRREENIKSFMAVPVRTPAGTGVLCIDSKRQYVFTPKVQKLLVGFADQVTRVLEKVDVYRQIGRHAVTLDDVQDYAAPLTASSKQEAVLDAACNIPKRLLKYDTAALVWRTPGEKDYCVVRCVTHWAGAPLGQRVSLESSLAGWVLSHGETFHLPTIKNDLQQTHLFHPNEPAWPLGAFLGLPLRTGREVFGMLAFARRTPGGFDDRERATAELLRTLISGALAAAQMHARWEGLHTVDEVTGLPNYPLFRSRLAEALEWASDTLRPVSVLIADAEEIEEVYANRGHRAGDRLMRELAGFYRRFLPDPDLLARCLGHRFVMALPGKDLEANRETPQRLQDTLENTYFRTGSEEVRLSVHIGLAVFPRDAATEAQLIAQGLRALEWGKTRGHETICASAEVKG